MTSYVHHLPGRLRLKLPALKRNAAYAQALQTSLSTVPGVLAVRANTLTGSLLISYDPVRVDGASLQRAVPGAPPAMRAVCPTCVTQRGSTAGQQARPSDKLSQALLGMVVEKAVEQSARTLLRVLL